MLLLVIFSLFSFGFIPRSRPATIRVGVWSPSAAGRMNLGGTALVTRALLAPAGGNPWAILTGAHHTDFVDLFVWAARASAGSGTPCGFGHCSWRRGSSGGRSSTGSSCGSCCSPSSCCSACRTGGLLLALEDCGSHKSKDAKARDPAVLPAGHVVLGDKAIVPHGNFHVFVRKVMFSEVDSY